MHLVVLEFGECSRGILTSVHADEGTTSWRNQVNGHNVPIFPERVRQFLLVHQLARDKTIRQF